VRRSLVVVLILGLLSAVGPTAVPASGAATPSACTSSELNVIDYNVSVAAGNVGQLFWVADTGSRSCTLSGYARATFWGTYGFVPSKKPAESLVVTEKYGRRNADFAGVATGRELPVVTLSPGGAIASFWIFGTDQPHQLADGHQSRCIVSTDMRVSLWPGPQVIIVAPERAGNFDWCGTVTIYPVVAGDTGSDPPYPLQRMFGPTL
jgi:hypothetical protein